MEYRVINSAHELLPYLEELKSAKIIAVDTETTGLDPHIDKLRLIQLAVPNIPVLVIDCFSFLPDGSNIIREVLNGDGIKIFHNAKFDLQFLRAVGLAAAPIFDTMLAAQLLRSSGGSKQANLAAVCKHYLSEDVDKTEQKGDFSLSLREEQLQYAAKDAYLLLKLREAMLPHILTNGLKKVAKLEFDCAQAMAQMEFDGIHLDLVAWKNLTRETEVLLKKSIEKLYLYCDKPIYQLTLWGEEIPLDTVNFDSNPFVMKLLKKNGIEVASTSKQHLASYVDHPLVASLMEYRKHSKALSTFLHPMLSMLHPTTGRLHPKYGQIGAWSGRMSCGGPNIQQIPRDMAFRRCFAAPTGRKLIIADYSQIELRVAAQISGDKRMLEAYSKGEDLHLLTASLISDTPMDKVSKAQRQAAKAVNFGLIFGMGAEGLRQYARQSYGVEMTLEQAKTFRDRFFKSYTGINDWHERIRKNKPTEERTLLGRKFVFGENSGLSGLYNTPVQGTAADILKIALGTIIERIKNTSISLVAVVHDEILLEADDAEKELAAKILRQTMEQSGGVALKNVPCVADVKIADNWAGK